VSLTATKDAPGQGASLGPTHEGREVIRKAVTDHHRGETRGAVMTADLRTNGSTPRNFGEG
jgi:hypothetical protein